MTIGKEQLTDLEVVERVINGEKSLYELIIRRYNPYLYKVGRSYNYNHDGTQDLMQDTFVDAYKNLDQFRGHSDFKTWLIRIMLNNCYRKKQKLSFKSEIAQEVYDNSIPMFMNSMNDTDKIIQNRELGYVIENALSEIPTDYRMVFSLREINGLSVAETAELLQISEANVKTRLNRSKAMLREKIQQSYSAAELYEFNLVYCNAIVKNVMKIINEL